MSAQMPSRDLDTPAGPLNSWSGPGHLRIGAWTPPGLVPTPTAGTPNPGQDPARRIFKPGGGWFGLTYSAGTLARFGLTYVRAGHQRFGTTRPQQVHTSEWALLEKASLPWFNLSGSIVGTESTQMQTHLNGFSSRKASL